MDAKAIGKRLANLRGSRSQAEIAKAVGVAPSTIGMYERGERIPRDDTKIKLASLYRTTVKKIFYS